VLPIFENSGGLASPHDGDNSQSRSMSVMAIYRYVSFYVRLHFLSHPESSAIESGFAQSDVNRIENRVSSCRILQRFDSVAEVSECTDHSQCAYSLGLLAYRRAAFLIANAFM
jgi:hypothetical protein